MDPKVILLSKTEAILETLYEVWMASKKDFTPDVYTIYSADQLEANFAMLLELDVPLLEMIDFIFLIKGASISWREQAVRHRIGSKVGDRVGVDIIPDLSSSTWWSQSMRIMDMGSFAATENYLVPESIRGNDDMEFEYRRAMDNAALVYRTLVDMGVPLEDARNLIPLGATHDIVWKLNLQSLRHIVGKRSCWILQAGLWEPVISGMVKELSSKVHQLFKMVSVPPCHKSDFNSCPFVEENRRRLNGDDCLPVCPIWFYHNMCHQPLNTDQIIDVMFEKTKGIDESFREEYIIDVNRRLDHYYQLWPFVLQDAK